MTAQAGSSPANLRKITNARCGASIWGTLAWNLGAVLRVLQQAALSCMYACLRCCLSRVPWYRGDYFSLLGLALSNGVVVSLHTLRWDKGKHQVIGLDIIEVPDVSQVPTGFRQAAQNHVHLAL